MNYQYEEAWLRVRAKLDDSAWVFIHNNARSFTHVNHFTFHPMKAILSYRVNTDQSNWSLLEIHTKAEVARTRCHNDFLGLCIDFLVTSYSHAILLDCQLRERPVAFPSLARCDAGMVRKRARCFERFHFFCSGQKIA